MGQRRLRLDAELVRRSLARSREHARELIASGRVSINGHRAEKPATGVAVDADIVVREPAEGEVDYASRGGHKLAGALAAFAADGLTVSGARCLDAGASDYVSKPIDMDQLLAVLRVQLARRGEVVDSAAPVSGAQGLERQTQ